MPGGFAEKARRPKATRRATSAPVRLQPIQLMPCPAHDGGQVTRGLHRLGPGTAVRPRPRAGILPASAEASHSVELAVLPHTMACAIFGVALPKLEARSPTSTVNNISDGSFSQEAEEFTVLRAHSICLTSAKLNQRAAHAARSCMAPPATEEAHWSSSSSVAINL